MSFLKDIVSEFTHQGQGQSGQSQNYPQQSGQQYAGPQYGQQQPSYGASADPDRLPYPWRKEWDQRDQRWVYLNDETRQSTFEHPFAAAQSQPQSYNQGYPPQGQYASPQPEPKKDHRGLEYGALGVVGGLAAGALLEHEGHEVKQDWDRDEQRVENRFDNGVDDVRYGADRVGDDVRDDAYRAQDRVEDFGDNVRYDADRVGDKIEDVPQDLAYGAGDVVGNVEGFDRREDNSFDAGEDRGRDDY